MRAEASRRESGFTLVELLVVLVIIALVASIGLVALMNALDKSRQRATMADMRTVSKAIEVYAVDHSFLPSDAGGMAGLRDQLVPYETSLIPILDHWNHPYVYSRDADGNYTLESLGKDGVDGDDITVDTRNDFYRDIVIVNGQFVAAPQ